MATCQHCGAFVALPFKCKYCGMELCPNCRLPPDHDCAWLDSWKSTSAPHAFVKMDRIHHPELWGPIRPGSRSFSDEWSDPRFYPLGDIPEEQPLSNLDQDEQIFNPGPRLEEEGWPSAYQGLRDWIHKRCFKIGNIIYCNPLFPIMDTRDCPDQVTVKLPPYHRAVVNQALRSGRYGNVSEFFRECIKEYGILRGFAPEEKSLSPRARLADINPDQANEPTCTQGDTPCHEP